MSRVLRVLLVEDSPEDAELIVRELTRAGTPVVSHRVQTAEAMVTALTTAPWDLVLSDNSLPGFSATGALQVLQTSGLDLPFIIVSGTIGEDAAVAALKAGANDFLIKGRLARLLPAVERELRDVEHRRAHRRAQEALRISEAEFRSLFEHAVFGIYRSSLDGRFLAVNPALVSMLGYADARDLLQVGVADVSTEPAAARDLTTQCLEDGTFRADTVWQRKGGTPVRVRLNGRVSEDHLTRTPVVDVIVEDVTVQHQLQEQLRHAQRMEALGQLAGGVAHDFNNMLTAILGYSELLASQIGPDKPIGQDLLEIKAAAERAAALTRQLLAFSRKQVVSLTVVDVSEVVRSVTPMLRRLLSERIAIATDLTDAVAPVMADAAQLEHVLVNLCLNARDAMPQGGTLRIATRNVRLDEHYAQTHPGATPGTYAALTVSDTGTGMTAEIQARIFEPFFTTKEAGRGTGLGLAAVLNTIQRLHGSIEVDSTVHVGTTFTIYLPRTHHAAAPQPRGHIAASPVGTETILLVEDEPGVRAFARVVLQRFGYRVLDAGSGERALEVLRQHAEPIHLLLTDIGLPGMDGRQVAERARHERPHLRVLFMSGYADRMPHVDEVRTPSVALLAKPFTADALLTKTRELLGPMSLEDA